MYTRPEYSKHAIVRLAQRGLSKDDVEYVVQHGRFAQNAKSQAYFLGAKDVPREDLRNDKYRRLVGTLVLLDTSGRRVLTAYRNKNAFRDHLRKRKYRIRFAA